MDTKQNTSWQLAHLAGCSDPDAHDGIGFSADQDVTPVEGSPGARFLRSIENDVFERIESNDWNEDASHEIADSAVPVYTHAMWTTFVDLCAYQEDPSDIVGDTSDMDKLASACLYIIADRLAHALTDEQDDDEAVGPYGDGTY